MTQEEMSELRVIAASAAETAGDVKAIRQWIEDRRPICAKHGEDIEELKRAGRPPSRWAIVTVTLLGQLLIGIGVVVAIVRS